MIEWQNRMICHSIILLSSYSLILFSHPILSPYHPILSSYSLILFCHSILSPYHPSLILFSHPTLSSYYHPIRSSYSEANRIRSESVFFFIILKKKTRFSSSWPQSVFFGLSFYTLQHAATHRNTLQHAITHCNTLATLCNTLQHTCTHCNTLEYFVALRACVLWKPTVL